MIHVHRVYDHGEIPPGRRFLVDRLWPRGVKKEALALDGWLRDASPSNELRHWYGHDPERWDEFRRRYFAALDAQPAAWAPLLEAARAGDVTLLFSAREMERSLGEREAKLLSFMQASEGLQTAS